MPEDERKVSLAVLIPVGLGLGLIAAVGVYALAQAAPLKKRSPCADYGDVDGDGYVTEEDAILIAQHRVGNIVLNEEQLRRADVTGDGRVTMEDSMIINQYVIDLIDTFPVCRIMSIG